MAGTVRIYGSCIVREVDGEILVLDTRSKKIHQLNRTASGVWRMLHEGQAPHAIAAALSEEFAVDAQVALDDVLKIQETFQALRLIAINPAT